MRHIYRHSIIVLVVILLAVASILPVKDRLKRGKDLAGGATLVYQVTVEAGDAGATINKLIEVLKERIDPGGVRDISITPLDNQRIEFSMPLPDDEVKRLRTELDAAIAGLSGSALTAEQLQTKMALPAAQREAELKAAAGSNTLLQERLAKAKAAFDAFDRAGDEFNARRPQLDAAVKAAQEALVAAQAAAPKPPAPPTDGSAPPPPPPPDPAVTAATQALEAATAARRDAARAVAVARTAYDKAKADALGTSISATTIRRALDRAAQGKLVTLLRQSDVDGLKASWAKAGGPNRPKDSDLFVGARVREPSARDWALSRLRTQYPELAPRIDDVAARYAALEGRAGGLNDTSDLKRILRGAGVLEFRIAVRPEDRADTEALRKDLREKGPTAISPDAKAAWFRLNKEEAWYESTEQMNAMRENPAAYFAGRGLVADEFDGEVYVLLMDQDSRQGEAMVRLTRAEGDWRVARAFPTSDDIGRPAIGFKMDSVGAGLMGNLTGGNVGKPMAIVLDRQLFSVANINSAIRSDGIIQGAFTQAEVDYVVRVLSAGALSGKLSSDPVSESVVGPELGADNLERGFRATAVSFVLVSGFMVVYYFAGGLVAVLALGINGLLLLALMSLNHAAFTLPGIAGIILTFGMAVDANVLIFERLREELVRGNDLRTAVRLAYSKALAAIVDGNVTNLIVCVVLGYFGTPEIRGFAITMSIGVLTTLFAQLYITRIIYVFFVDRLNFRGLGNMLPLAVPALQRMITPNVDWLRYRWVFWSFSAALTLACVGVLVVRGSDLLDTEFKGGTRVTVQLKDDAQGRPMIMTRADVQAAVAKIGLADVTGPLANLKNAEILALNPLSDAQVRARDPNADTRQVWASRFLVKSDITDGPRVASEVFKSEALRGKVEELPRLGFDTTSAVPERVPVVPLLAPVLRENFELRPELAPVLARIRSEEVLRSNVAEFSGGAAIVFTGISPPEPLSRLEARFSRLRSATDFSASQERTHRLIVAEGSAEAVSGLIILVKDPRADFLQSERDWTRAMAADAPAPSEMNLAISALKLSQAEAGVESFSPSVARSFLAQATVAVLLSTVLIIIYVWVRFTYLRYSVAAIVTTLHDCVVAVGFIAAAELLVVNAPGVADSLGVLPFKIDLNVVAAVLTILGYSLNDTIVVMDRIRENRGKRSYASREVINASINQTFSRTLMTGGSVVIATLVLYAIGGEALRAFAFCFLVGVLTGTYSSVALAAPIVWQSKLDTGPGGRAPQPASPSATGGPGGGGPDGSRKGLEYSGPGRPAGAT